MVDLMEVKDLVKKKTVVKMKWVLTTHMLAHIFTKDKPTNGIFQTFYETRRSSLSQNKEEGASEEQRRLLRLQQRQHRKERQG